MTSKEYLDQRQSNLEPVIVGERRRALRNVAINTPGRVVFENLGLKPENVAPIYVIGGADFYLPPEQTQLAKQTISEITAAIVVHFLISDPSKEAVVLNCSSGMISDFSGAARDILSTAPHSLRVIGVGAQARVFSEENPVPSPLPDYLADPETGELKVGQYTTPVSSITDLVLVSRPNNAEQSTWWGTTELLLNMAGDFALLANGGIGTLEEIIAVLDSGKKLIILAESGRIADQVADLAEYKADSLTSQHDYVQEFHHYIANHPNWRDQVTVVHTKNFTRSTNEVIQDVLSALV